MGIGRKRNEENSNKVKLYFDLLCRFCAFGMWNVLKRRRNESSRNAIGVSTERGRLGKRVRPSHSLTKCVELESSAAHRHFAVSYARNVASKRAIL